MRRLITNAESAAITVAMVFGLWLLLAVAAQAQEVGAWAHGFQYEIESPQEIEARKARWRGIVKEIKRIYGAPASTPREQNVTVYDFDGRFEIFRGGLKDYGDYESIDVADVSKPEAVPSSLCGKQEQRGAVRIMIACPDWPAIRRLTGATMFPNEKGVQVFVRSSDPATAAFSISIRYRKFGYERTQNALTLVHPQSDSGAGWLVGDAELIAVEVTELRESAKAEIR